MIDPSLLKALRDVARDEEERRADDAVWIARASGKLSEAERAGTASPPSARDDGETEAEFMRALTAPNATALEERIASVVRAAAPQRAVVVPIAKAQTTGRPRARLFYFGAPILAAAAAAALLLRTPATTGNGLPAYLLAVEGGDMASRGDAPAPIASERITFTAGAHVVVIARPVAPASTPVTATAYLVRDSERRPLGIQAEVSPSGAVRLEGSSEQLFGDARGDWVLVLAIRPVAGDEKAAGEYRQPVKLIERK